MGPRKIPQPGNKPLRIRKLKTRDVDMEQASAAQSAPTIRQCDCAMLGPRLRPHDVHGEYEWTIHQGWKQAEVEKEEESRRRLLDRLDKQRTKDVATGGLNKDAIRNRPPTKDLIFEFSSMVRGPIRGREHMVENSNDDTDVDRSITYAPNTGSTVDGVASHGQEPEVSMDGIPEHSTPQSDMEERRQNPRGIDGISGVHLNMTGRSGRKVGEESMEPIKDEEPGKRIYGIRSSSAMKYKNKNESNEINIRRPKHKRNTKGPGLFKLPIVDTPPGDSFPIYDYPTSTNAIQPFNASHIVGMSTPEFTAAVGGISNMAAETEQIHRRVSNDVGFVGGNRVRGGSSSPGSSSSGTSSTSDEGLASDSEEIDPELATRVLEGGIRNGRGSGDDASKDQDDDTDGEVPHIPRDEQSATDDEALGSVAPAPGLSPSSSPSSSSTSSASSSSSSSSEDEGSTSDESSSDQDNMSGLGELVTDAVSSDGGPSVFDDFVTIEEVENRSLRASVEECANDSDEDDDFESHTLDGRNNEDNPANATGITGTTPPHGATLEDLDDNDTMDELDMLDEIADATEQAYIKEEIRRTNSSERKFNYRGRKKRIGVVELSTLSLGDVVNRFKVPRAAVGEFRDYGQTYAAAAVRDALESLKRSLPDAAITDDLMDEITANVLDSRKYKPGDGRAFYKLLKERTGFSKQVFDCCIGGCMSYAPFPDRTCCKKCKLPRWENVPVNDKDLDDLPTGVVIEEKTEREKGLIGKLRRDIKDNKREPPKPFKRHVYFPVRHRLMLWYTSHYLSMLMVSYRRKAANMRRRGLLTDFWSGELFEELRIKDGVFKDDREVGFVCGFDGTKAFKTRKNRYVYPIILTCLNLPPEMRFKRRNVLVCGFIPGPGEPKDVDSFLKPLVDEFVFLSENGTKAWDAGKKEEFRLRAHIVLFSTDMPARVKLMRTMGFGSSSYCEYCQVKGLYYAGMHCPHKPAENLTRWIKRDQQTRTKKNRPCYNYRIDYTYRNSRMRTDEEFRASAEYLDTNKNSKYAERTGIAGKTVLMRLRTLRFARSFPPCTMHLYFENVSQRMMEHYSGRFFGPRQKRDGEESLRANVPLYTRAKGNNDKFRATSEEFNIKPRQWIKIGEDTKKSNATYPDQFGEEMTDLYKTFRRMKAANWQRFMFHQSPIYFRKYLPKEHYDQWMNLVEAMRLSTRRVLSLAEIDEVEERLFQFVEYYEKTFYRHDINRISACLPVIHQLRHVHDALRDCGPCYIYAQWCMERVNGLITQAIRSKGKPDENIAAKLELDAHTSLLPFVIPYMDTVMAKKAFEDNDGRLKLHKLLRYMVAIQDEFASENPRDPDNVIHGRVGKHNKMAKEPEPGKLNSIAIESLLTDYSTGMTDQQQAKIDEIVFNLNTDQILQEFGGVTNTDIRRALRRIGDVILVDQLSMQNGKQILTGPEYKALRDFVAGYINVCEGTLGSMPSDMFAWTDEEGVSVSPKRSDPLVKGLHGRNLKPQKWRNIRFERTMKIGSYVVDERVVRISAARYPRANRIRSASFVEYSTEFFTEADSGGYGAHTVGKERASCRRISANSPRQFGEVQFFFTIDLGPSSGKTLYLAYIEPLSVRFEDGLTVVNNSGGKMRTKQARWIDVEDIVDLVGLVYCEGDYYVCWRDACWDAVARREVAPLKWSIREARRQAGEIHEDNAVEILPTIPNKNNTPGNPEPDDSDEDEPILNRNRQRVRQTRADMTGELQSLHTMNRTEVTADQSDNSSGNEADSSESEYLFGTDPDDDDFGYDEPLHESDDDYDPFGGQGGGDSVGEQEQDTGSDSDIIGNGRGRKGAHVNSVVGNSSVATRSGISGKGMATGSTRVTRSGLKRSYIHDQQVQQKDVLNGAVTNNDAADRAKYTAMKKRRTDGTTGQLASSQKLQLEGESLAARERGNSTVTVGTALDHGRSSIDAMEIKVEETYVPGWDIPDDLFE